MAWAVVALAAVLRLSYLDLIPFRMEQIWYLQRPLTCGTAAGACRPPSPMLNYVLSVSLAIGRDARISAALIALLHVASVGAMFCTARRFYGTSAAVVSSVLMAVSPWDVYFSRSIGPSSLTVPLATALLFGLLAALCDRNRWGSFLASVAMSLLLFSTPYSLPLLLANVTLYIAYMRRISWVYVLLGVCLSILLFAPYLRMQNLVRLRDVWSGPGSVLEGPDAQPLGLDALRYAGWLLSGQMLVGSAFSPGPSTAPGRLGAALLRLAQDLFVLSVPAVVILAVRAWSRWREGRDNAAYTVLAVWLVLSLGVLTLRPTGFAPGAFLVLLPAGFLAMGVMIGWILKPGGGPDRRIAWWTIPLRLVVWLVALGIFGASILTTLGLLTAGERDGVADGYGLAYRYWRRTAKLVGRVAQEDGADRVWVIARGTDPSVDEEPAILDWVMDPELVLTFLGTSGNASLLLPAERSGVYLLTRVAPIERQAIERLGGEEAGLVLLPNPSASHRSFVVPQRTTQALLGEATTRGIWHPRPGLQLVGYHLPPRLSPGQEVNLTSYWTFLGADHSNNAANGTVSFSFGREGGEYVQCATLGLPALQWEDSFLLTQWTTIQLPDTMPIGTYDVGLRAHCSESTSVAPTEDPDRVSIGAVEVVRAAN